MSYSHYGFLCGGGTVVNCGGGGGGGGTADPLLVNNLQVAQCLSGINAPLKICGDLEVQGFVDVQNKLINTTQTAVLVDQPLDVNGDINILSSEINFTNGVRMSGNDIASGDTVVSAINIGSNGKATGTDSINIGNNSQALLGGSIAIGEGAISSASFAIAIGEDSQAVHNSSTALGRGAVTTEANQVRLGTATKTVSIPGDLDIDGDTITAGKIQMATLSSAADPDLLQIPTYPGIPTSTVPDGNMMIDTANDRLYYRTNSSWEFVQNAQVSNLENVLAAGNTSGTNNIIMSNNTSFFNHSNFLAIVDQNPQLTPTDILNKHEFFFVLTGPATNVFPDIGATFPGDTTKRIIFYNLNKFPVTLAQQGGVVQTQYGSVSSFRIDPYRIVEMEVASKANVGTYRIISERWDITQRTPQVIEGLFGQNLTAEQVVLSNTIIRKGFNGPVTDIVPDLVASTSTWNLPVDYEKELLYINDSDYVITIGGNNGTPVDRLYQMNNYGKDITDNTIFDEFIDLPPHSSTIFKISWDNTLNNRWVVTSQTAPPPEPPATRGAITLGSGPNIPPGVGGEQRILVISVIDFQNPAGNVNTSDSFIKLEANSVYLVCSRGLASWSPPLAGNPLVITRILLFDPIEPTTNTIVDNREPAKTGDSNLRWNNSTLIYTGNDPGFTIQHQIFNGDPVSTLNILTNTLSAIKIGDI